MDRSNLINGTTWPEDCFLSPVLAKGFLQLSPEAAMLLGPRVETRPPHPACPTLSAGAEPKSQGHYRK